MKIIEKIFLFLLFLGIILKFNLVLHASMLIIITSLILSLIYGAFSFAILNNVSSSEVFKKSAYSGISRFHWVYVIIGGLCLQVLILGILFKLMWWYDYNAILLTGLISSLIVLTIAIIEFIKHKERFYRLILIRFTPLFIFGLVLFFPDDLTIFKFQYRNEPIFLEAYRIHKEDPDNKEKFDRMEMEQKRTMLSDEDFKRLYPNEK